MKVFKQLFRSVVLVGFVGGWAVAASAVHLVRTPSNKLPVLLTKDHFGFVDTYADTRNWTLADDKAHPILVARLVELHRTDLLLHTLSATDGPADAQLAAAAQNAVPPQGVDLAGKVKNVTDAFKAKIN